MISPSTWVTLPPTPITDFTSHFCNFTFLDNLHFLYICSDITQTVAPVSTRACFPTPFTAKLIVFPVPLTLILTIVLLFAPS